MDVLKDQRKGFFAPVRLARLAEGAGRRVGPERLVIGAAIVITGEAESSGGPQDQHRGGKREERRPPARLFRHEQGRIEGREIWAVGVVGTLHRGPGGIYDEGRESQENQKWFDPPGVFSGSPAKAGTRSFSEAAVAQRDVNR